MGRRSFTFMAKHMETGREGEGIALAHLRALGYPIRGRNVRIGRDEIDIVAFDPKDQVVVFVEVKSRSRFDKDFRPELNVTGRKRGTMLRAARRWVARHRYDGGYRVDVVSVAEGRVLDHFKEVNWGWR